jgi:superfamily I DNA and/or RNA helicase
VKYKVAVTTCSGSGHDVFLRFASKQAFKGVILDECTQQVLPSTLVPLTLGAERVALLGDHQQLPPTILDEDAAKSGFDRSLFERVVKTRPQWSVLLDVQWRMHPSIAEFPSWEFYRQGVRSHPSCSRLEQVEGIPWPATGVSVVCISVNGIETSTWKSYKNIAEADEIVELLKRVKNVNHEDIGVITPYNGQKKLLKERLWNDFWKVTVDTVDGFQGREKDVVILTMVRSNLEQEIGFLADLRRTNVALTRARKKLIVIGDSATLSSNPFYSELFEHFEDQKSYSSIWEHLS